MAGLNLSQFLLQCALGTLPAQRSSERDRLDEAEERLGDVEKRLARLERLARGYD